MDDLFQMQIFKKSKFGTAIWVAKLVLLLVGMITTGILFKVAILPTTFNFIPSTMSMILISIRFWLFPPYVYILLNFIILTIAASSLFHHPNATHPIKNKNKNKTKNSSAKPKTLDTITTITIDSFDMWQEIIKENETEDLFSNLSFEKPIKSSFCFPLAVEKQEKQSSPISRTEEVEIVSNNDDMVDDSLEETWMMIMEGKGEEPRKQLKKSDTWKKSGRKRLQKFNAVKIVVDDDGGGGDGDDDPVSWARREMRKSDTFSDEVSLRRDKSMTHDELNQRADAFIKKFNYEMRLQRQESEQRCMEMVN